MMIEIFVGAFLGFLSALATEWLVRYLEAKSMSRSVLSSISAESRTNLTRLKSANLGEYAHVSLHDRTAWSAAMGSGQLRSISRLDTVRMAAAMYHRLDSLEKWQQIRMQALLSNHPGQPAIYATAAAEVVQQMHGLAIEAIEAFLREHSHE